MGLALTMAEVAREMSTTAKSVFILLTLFLRILWYVFEDLKADCRRDRSVAGPVTVAGDQR